SVVISEEKAMAFQEFLPSQKGFINFIRYLLSGNSLLVGKVMPLRRGVIAKKQIKPEKIGVR
ncbi:MAG: hypothetical protein KBF93_10465, partial [Leptospiraceae bacterium]|nr:hypothetical protein [Leptospiraceae bacterium]